MDENRKRDRSPEISSAVAGKDRKRAKTPAAEYEDDDDVASLLSVDWDAFAALREILEGSPSLEKVSPAPVLAPETYSAVIGNMESCGSLVSDCVSTVMAGFDFSGIRFLFGGAWVPEAARGGDVKGLDGWDYSDEFDEMLARFLGEDVYEN